MFSARKKTHKSEHKSIGFEELLKRRSMTTSQHSAAVSDKKRSKVFQIEKPAIDDELRRGTINAQDKLWYYDKTSKRSYTNSQDESMAKCNLGERRLSVYAIATKIPKKQSLDNVSRGIESKVYAIARTSIADELDVKVTLKYGLLIEICRIWILTVVS